MKNLEKALGYTFRNPALLKRALTHPSMGRQDNQRLEFLGDAVLQYLMSDKLYREHPETPKDAFVLNIEQFHIVNALNGRDFGDQILRILGNEVLTIAREYGGIAGRFGADRFDIYCKHTPDYRAMFDRLQNKLVGMVPNASVRIRMGVMPWQARLEPVQQFDMARTACSMARGHYKEHLIVFDEKVRERELLDQRLLNDLRRALDNYEFEVYYQPKYDIQAEPPQMVSAEALIRWQHPELGMIAPDAFIPLFERNGKICEVDKYVWAQAARQIARWRAQFGVTIPVSVNLSRVDVFDPTLMDTLDGILRENGLNHDTFKLEVTETAYTENSEQVIRVVERLRGKGFTVEMDDFGTGYSSLNMLKDLPVDVLKIDRSFLTENADEHESASVIIGCVVSLAAALSIRTICEGIETREQAVLLTKLGCDMAQGFFFARPMPVPDYEKLTYGIA